MMTPQYFSTKRPTLPSLVVPFLTACATSYQRMGATGGYADVQLDATTFRVEFSGNGFTARSRVEAFVLYRCAELTLEHGFSHFAVLNGGTSAENSTVNLPSTTNGNVTVVGNTAYWNSTTTPGQQIPVTKFGSTVM